MNAVDVAAQLGVDPKTVDRWLTGRLPYPKHRQALARLTGWPLHDLWPELPKPALLGTEANEVRIVYPHRSAVPADAWSRLFAKAQHDIGILAYSALFLAEDIAVSTVLRDKAKAGVRVRIALGQPSGRHITDRGAEEGIGDGMSARIHNALVGFSPLLTAGVELRLHDTVLYNSVYCADDEALVNTHVYGHPASHAPVVHLRLRSDMGMATAYLDSFEQVWAASRDCNG